MRLRFITDHRNIDRNKWDSFVWAHPKGNVFQSSAFYYFINSIAQYKPLFICAIDETNKIAGIISGILQKETGLKSYFSRRAIIYGGPLVIDDNADLLHQLLYELKKYLRNKAIYIEFRNLDDFSYLKSTFQKQGFSFVPHLNFLVHLNNNEDVWKNLSKSRVRQIRKAKKNGAVYRIAENISDVHQFYNLLTDLYKKKIKKPLPPVDFFVNFFNTGLGEYILVYNKDVLIGGMMCPIDENKIYEWYICGLDNEYEDLYPSVFVTYSAIDYGLKHNLKYFDFMGAGSPDKDYGVREFKARFGGEVVTFGRFKYIMNKPLYFLGETAMLFLKQIKFK